MYVQCHEGILWAAKKSLVWHMAYGVFNVMGRVIGSGSVCGVVVNMNMGYLFNGLVEAVVSHGVREYR